MWNEVRKTAVGACLLPRRYSLSYMTLHEEKGDNQYHQFHSHHVGYNPFTPK